MKKIKDEDKKTTNNPESVPATDNTAELEAVLADFVKSFENSAQRWEHNIYPFINSFQSSTKRWERMIYPAIIIFGIMAVSGFWLIYSLTSDVHELSMNVDPRMEKNLATMSENISTLSDSVKTMTREVKNIRVHIESMDSSIDFMRTDMRSIAIKLDTLPPLLRTIQEMDQSIKMMTVNTGRISYDLSDMNDTIGPPMSIMNTFTPW